MSLLPTATRVAGLAPVPPERAGVRRRVRHQARDVALMMVFSAVSSTAVAVGLLGIAQLAGTGR